MLLRHENKQLSGTEMDSTNVLTTLIEKHRTYVRTNSLLMEVAVAPIRPEDHAFVFQASVLVDLRRKLDLNQAELAESLDVPVNTLSRWERGSNVPDANALAVLFSIAKERGVEARIPSNKGRAPL